MNEVKILQINKNSMNIFWSNLVQQLNVSSHFENYIKIYAHKIVVICNNKTVSDSVICRDVNENLFSRNFLLYKNVLQYLIRFWTIMYCYAEEINSTALLSVNIRLGTQHARQFQLFGDYSVQKSCIMFWFIPHTTCMVYTLSLIHI